MKLKVESHFEEERGFSKKKLDGFFDEFKLETSGKKEFCWACSRNIKCPKHGLKKLAGLDN